MIDHLSESENELNSPAEIEEKQFISDLQLAFNANRGRPDDRWWWAVARRTIRQMLKEPARTLPDANLFLRFHYPFFNTEVQSILMERHLDNCSMIKESPWHAVEGYLLAEQYGLTAYGESPFNNLDLIEGRHKCILFLICDGFPGCWCP